MKPLRSLILIAVFFGSAEKGSAAASDTVIIAASEQEVRIDRQHPKIFIPLQVNHQKPGGDLYIRFEGITLKKAPEGIYEVYLADAIPDIERLKDTSILFVHTLNTYYLSGQGSHWQLMNAGRQLGIIQKTNNKSGPFFLIIVFRGNKYPNGKPSVDAGELIIRSANLICTKS